MRILATLGLKGGVGKTASTVALAHRSAQAGARVLLCDLDPQGAATYLLRGEAQIDGGGKGLTGRKGALGPHIVGTDDPTLDLLPADFSFRRLDKHLARASKPLEVFGELLAPHVGEYEEVWLDCPAGLGLLVENAVVAADALLAPLIPAELSLRTLEILRNVSGRLRPEGVPLLPFLSLVDRRSAAHRETAAALREADPQVLQASVPLARDVERMAERREPIACYAPRGKAAQAIDALWDEVQQRLEAAGV